MVNPVWQSFPVAIAPGGLSQSRAIPEPGDMIDLHNFVNFRGRWGLRPGAEDEGITLTTNGSTAVDQVLDIIDFNGEFWIATFETSAGTQLQRYTKAGVLRERVTVWSDSAAPLIQMEVMAASDGTEVDTSEQRLYVTDYLQSQNHWSRYVVPDQTDPYASTITDLLLDLDLDNASQAQERCFFRTFKQYQYHMWGTGFHYRKATAGDIILRGEMLRFSQPGLLPGVDEDEGDYSLTQDWWKTDWRGVGARYDDVIALSQSAGGMVVGKKRELYVISGFDRDSWALEQLSRKVGIIGPNAADYTDEGLCFFWSEKGPLMTDAQRVVDLGEDIREYVNLTSTDEAYSVQYSPDDGLVYFITSVAGSTGPDRFFTFDVQRQKWARGEWWLGSSTRVLVNVIRSVGVDTLPGPASAPSSLAVQSKTYNSVFLEWTNGDTAIGTTTEIWGKLNSATSGNCGTVPTGWAMIDSVVAGVDEYNATGLNSRNYHCFAVRHLRNGQYSSWSNQTDLAPPNSLACEAKSDGITLNWVNVESTGNVQIQRRALPSGSFGDLDNPANGGAGAQQYNDTTCTCSTEYEYRVRAEEASWDDSDWSNTDSKECCLSPISISLCEHDLTALTAYCPDPNNVQIDFTISGAQPGDTYKVWRSLEASSGSPSYDDQRDYGSASNGSNTVYDTFGAITGSDTRYLQYKIEVYDGGVTLVDSCETTEETISIDSTANCPE